jgi:polyhydroxyalkanoate synthesis regulator phasin
MKFTNKQEAKDYVDVLRYRIEQLGVEIEEKEEEQSRLIESYIEACRYVEFK